MKNLFITAAAAAILTACGQNADAPADVEGTVERGGEAAVNSAQRALEDLGNITLRSGDAAEAGEALAAMSLAESGTGRVSFEGSSRDGDGASFSDVTISVPGDDGDENDGAGILIGTLELDGLDMVDGQASFAKMSMDNIRLVPNDPEDAEEGELTVANIEVLNPSPALAAWVASLTGNGAPADFPTGADLAFDAVSLSDMAFNLDDGSDTVALNLSGIQMAGASETGIGEIRKGRVLGNRRVDQSKPISPPAHIDRGSLSRECRKTATRYGVRFVSREEAVDAIGSSRRDIEASTPAGNIAQEKTLFESRLTSKYGDSTTR